MDLIWEEISNPFGEFTEGENVDITLAATARTVFVSTIQGQTSFPYDGITPISDVLVNEFSVGYTTLSNSIILNNPITKGSVVIIIYDIPITYKVILGKLPKGLVLETNGRLHGVVDNIVTTDDYKSFIVVVRAKNEYRIIDKELNIICYPIVDPPVWNYDILPDLELDYELNALCYNIATLRRGEFWSYDLSPLSFDEVKPSVILGAIVGVSTISTNGVIPDGLSYSPIDAVLHGNVSYSVEPGKYFLSAVMITPSAPAPINLCITILNDTTVFINPPLILRWLTPSGNLGTINELSNSLYVVKALSSGGNEVSYELAPGSDDLPLGLELDSVTGEIYGYPLQIDRTTNFEFTIRASSIYIHEDRNFSITVRHKYSEEVVRAILPFELVQSRILMEPYKILPLDVLFRPNDQDYGIIKNPHIYMVDGLGNGNFTNAISDYHGPLRLILGEHKFVTVYDENKKPIYDVLYREIIDPQFGAGGFSVSTIPEEEKVIWLQNPTNIPKYVYPASLNNMRMDLIKDIGFATDLEDYKYLVGPSGIENLPVWMKNVTNTDQTGYVNGVVIAYLQLNKQDKIRSLLSDPSIIKSGKVFHFDRYLVTNRRTDDTIFDTNGLQVLIVDNVIGINTLDLGRWANSVQFMYVFDGSSQILWEENINYTIDAGILTFVEQTSSTILALFVDGNPLGPLFQNSPIGNVLNTGSLSSSIRHIIVNGNPLDLDDYDINGSTIIFDTTYNGSQEILITMEQTVFIDHGRLTEFSDLIENTKYYEISTNYQRPKN